MLHDISLESGLPKAPLREHDPLTDGFDKLVNCCDLIPKFGIKSSRGAVAARPLTPPGPSIDKARAGA
jgi:hypothetical protein